MENKIAGVKITNPDKTLFEKDKITKLELINYYHDIAPLMLKHLKNRPVSVFRCHGGICGDCFFKKHPSTEGADIGKIQIDGEDYFLISSIRELVFQVQMGTIEFHTWGSKYPKLEQPDTMIFDLDPAEDVSLEKLRHGTLLVKSVLDEIGLSSDLKTSGGKGYHIIVMFKKRKTWDEFAEIAHKTAVLLEMKWPDTFTTNMRKEKRHGKIFVDYLRNKRGASCVCAFSVRARDGAPISFPISWDELFKIKPNEITIKNYKKYLKN